jgi:hypothetical protein
MCAGGKRRRPQKKEKVFAGPGSALGEAVPHHKTQQTAPPAGALPDEICIFKGDIAELFYYTSM